MGYSTTLGERLAAAGVRAVLRGALKRMHGRWTALEAWRGVLYRRWWQGCQLLVDLDQKTHWGGPIHVLESSLPACQTSLWCVASGIATCGCLLLLFARHPGLLPGDPSYFAAHDGVEGIVARSAQGCLSSGEGCLHASRPAVSAGLVPMPTWATMTSTRLHTATRRGSSERCAPITRAPGPQRGPPAALARRGTPFERDIFDAGTGHPRAWTASSGLRIQAPSRCSRSWTAAALQEWRSPRISLSILGPDPGGGNAGRFRAAADISGRTPFAPPRCQPPTAAEERTGNRREEPAALVRRRPWGTILKTNTCPVDDGGRIIGPFCPPSSAGAWRPPHRLAGTAWSDPLRFELGRIEPFPGVRP